MFQPRVKLEFVRRYRAPEAGWRVCVDIDPSEEGWTGSKRNYGIAVTAPITRRQDRAS